MGRRPQKGSVELCAYKFPTLELSRLLARDVSKRAPEPQAHILIGRMTQSQAVDGSQSEVFCAGPKNDSSELPRSRGISTTRVIEPVESGHTSCEAMDTVQRFMSS